MLAVEPVASAIVPSVFTVTARWLPSPFAQVSILLSVGRNAAGMPVRIVVPDVVVPPVRVAEMVAGKGQSQSPSCALREH